MIVVLWLSLKSPKANTEMSILHKWFIKEISPGETISKWEKNRIGRGGNKASVPFLYIVPVGDA